MDTGKLKQLIVEHKERFLAPAELIKREGQEIVAPYIKQKEIIVLSGVRRAGKSSLMKLICNDILKTYEVPAGNILYLNFEDERFIEFTHRDFEPLYETFMELYQPDGRKYFFLDEIQNIDGWGKWVNRMYEFEDVKIFLTSSNSYILSPETATALTGRNRLIPVYPFSFSEFLSFKNYKVNTKDLYLREGKIKLKRLFRQYVESGGFPEVLKNNDTTILEQYFKDIIYRDVIARYAIRNAREIRELALFLASNIGTIKSYQNLMELIHVKSLNTVKNYLGILENVYLFLRLDMFDYSVKRQIYNPSKIYAIDTALSSSIAFKFSQNLGHIYENIVFIELLRRGHEMFYWKSKSGKEVDFLIKKGLKIDRAIQVSADLTKSKTRQREIEGLLNAAEELNVKNLTIITEDEEGEEKIGKLKIGIIPIWKWCIENN